MSETRLAYRTCPLCEATCGLEVTIGPAGVERIRGDAADVFSKGYICPKGASIGDLHHDPDRLRQPHVRRPDGSHEAVGWDEAFAEVERLLVPILEAHGPDAIGAYVGNPMGHSLAGSLYLRGFHKMLGTRSLYTVGTIDQQPKSLASGLLYGSQFTVGIPDVDRTSHLLVLGANPVVSNGSLIAAPDMRGRLRAIRARGGKVVVVDPVRTRTAREADEHHFIRPGTDALLLAAMAHTLFDEELVRLRGLDAHVTGLTEVQGFVEAFPPERVARACGIEATQIRRLARELAAAESAAVYGRIGTTLQAFGTAASWLVDVLNVLTGNLDRPGGVMFTTPAAGGPTFIGEPGRGSGVSTARWHSRVRGLPEVLGELPLACLAEEIDTPGEGRLRALVTFSGNPALSNPNGRRLEAALGQLECLVCIDFYLNETTRQAHVILPPPSPLERAHYDLAVYPTAVRNVANYSPPALPLPADARDEWEIVLALTAIVGRLGAAADLEALDRQVALDALRRRCADPHSSIAGRDADELLVSLEPRSGEQRLLDIYLRCGPYGDAFGARPGGLTLGVLEETPHGIDFGPLEPRLPGVLRTPSGKDRARPSPLPRRERTALRPRRRRAAGHAARRAARATIAQLVDAQPALAHRRQGTVHRATPPLRCHAPRARGRRRRDPHVAGRLDHDHGRGERRSHAGRRLGAARLGPRRPGRPAARCLRAGRDQREPAVRRADRGRSLRDDRPERDPGHAHTRVEASPPPRRPGRDVAVPETICPEVPVAVDVPPTIR